MKNYQSIVRDGDLPDELKDILNELNVSDYDVLQIHLVKRRYTLLANVGG